MADPTQMTSAAHTRQLLAQEDRSDAASPATRRPAGSGRRATAGATAHALTSRNSALAQHPLAALTDDGRGASASHDRSKLGIAAAVKRFLTCNTAPSDPASDVYPRGLLSHTPSARSTQSTSSEPPQEQAPIDPDYFSTDQRQHIHHVFGEVSPALEELLARFHRGRQETGESSALSELLWSTDIPMPAFNASSSAQYQSIMGEVNGHIEEVGKCTNTLESKVKQYVSNLKELASEFEKFASGRLGNDAASEANKRFVISKDKLQTQLEEDGEISQMLYKNVYEAMMKMHRFAVAPQ